jgi:alkaline phosphatase D
MAKFFQLFGILILLAVGCGKTTKNLTQEETQTVRIAFGSCNKQYLEPQLWPEIVAQNPSLWIWSGDNIYADTDDMDKMRSMYHTFKNRADYQDLLKNVPVIGVWDDHDYGINDGGKYFTKKDESKKLLLEFLDVPKEHEVWEHDGVYQSYLFGEGDQRYKIILLDTRYFRDTIYRTETDPKAYLPNMEGDVLGEAQWAWLENELSDSDAHFHIIVSSIQFLSAQHRFEKWANFPLARERMIRLLEKTQPNRLFFISGDRHISEISRLDSIALPYPLYDVTSSGMTHTWKSEWPGEQNDLRIGETLRELSYGVMDLDFNQNQVHIQLKGFADTTYLDYTISF